MLCVLGVAVRHLVHVVCTAGRNGLSLAGIFAQDYRCESARKVYLVLCIAYAAAVLFVGT